MKKKKELALSNTKIAIVFFVFLGVIVSLSLIFKAILIVRAGQFDDSRRFTLTIDNGRNIEVMSLAPSSKNIVIFKMADNIKSAEAGKFLEIPIDGFIALNSLDLNQKINSLFVRTIFNYNNLKTNLTVIDLIKLAMFARSIPESSINIKIVGKATAPDLDKIVNRLVSDNLIEKDSQTIQIINGTDIAGLGNRLAKFVTNMGGNVIIVATSDGPHKKSFISYIDKKTYTVDRLQKVLGYEVRREAGDAISDIAIVIGEDGINNPPF